MGTSRNICHPHRRGGMYIKNSYGHANVTYIVHVLILYDNYDIRIADIW